MDSREQHTAACGAGKMGEGERVDSIKNIKSRYKKPSLFPPKCKTVVSLKCDF